MSADLGAAADALIASGETLEPYLPSRYVPHAPHPTQAAALSPPVTSIREVFYGGAAGGGKSDWLLMAALQFAEVPGYAALLLRRSYADLALEGALMQRSHEWLDPSDASWSDVDHRWTFPSGASLTFGYLEHAGDEQRYASAEFQMIGFDEVSQFPEEQYRFLFSRLRRTRGLGVPLRMRCASNPIGPGKAWVQARFVDAATSGRLFIPARLEDNPAIDAESYEESLRELGSVIYRALRYGDWDVKPEGRAFKRAWFEVVSKQERPDRATRVRRWDLAATETPKGRVAKRMGDPDYTVGLLLARSREGVYYVEDVVRGRWSSAKVEEVVASTAEDDGHAIPIRMEQEPGASGKALISHYRREVLDGFEFRGVPSTGSKETRAAPVAARAEAGEIKLIRGPWVAEFLDEIAEFPEGLHDDQVDALSGAFFDLARKRASSGRTPPKPEGFTAGSHWTT